jgi:hypothetical protein
MVRDSITDTGEKVFSSSPKRTYRLWDLLSFLMNEYRGFSPGGKRPEPDVAHFF